MAALEQAKSVEIDLLDIQPSTIKIDILHPATNEPIGLVVECQSFESDAAKAVQRNIANKAMRSGRNTQTAEKLESNSIAILAATIVGWSWSKGLKLGGLENPPLTGENKSKLLSVGWIYKQIDTRVADEAAFFTK